MITVHHLNNSRSQRILWMLEELGVEYDIKYYQRDKKTMLAPPELKKVHPLGKSPVITDGHVTLAESGAIIDYLGMTYGREFYPEPGTAEHRQYSYWLHYAEGSLMPQLLMRLIFSRIKSAPMPFFVRPIARQIADRTLNGYVRPNIKTNLDFVEDHLSKNSWFCGDRLTGADFQMSFPLEGAVFEREDRVYPHIAAFVKKIQARPAYQSALERGGPYAFA